MAREMIDLTDTKLYAHWATDTVRFSDQDAVGHVNNVAIAAYLETGRIAFNHEVIAPLLPAESGFILANLSIDYRRESHWPGAVRIGSRLVRVGRTSFTVGSGVFRDDVCVATATAVIVHRNAHGNAPFDAASRVALIALLPA